jgi:hypothetical protein
MGHHKRKHQYSFKDFKRDIIKPIGHTAMHVEKDVVGVYKSGFNALGKFGSSMGTPLLIIGVGVIAFVVINRGSLR